MSLALLSAVDQLQLLRTKQVSPLELAEEHIGRIERLNPTFNAILNFDPESVRSQAREQAGAVTSGTLAGLPLTGLPLTIKASIAVAGQLCEIGSLLRKGQTSTTDAIAVANLRAAGAVILGTTNCPELLMAYETDNLLYGRTHNPWDLARTPGGSSGGEAAAIAAGLSAGGLGSDSGGSVRLPAHFSGICALKPTSGRISPIGHIPPNIGPFATLGAIGPMARTIPDVELLFRIASNPRPDDAPSNPKPYTPVPLDAARHLRIGYLEDDGLIPVTHETRQAILAAAEALRQQGFTVIPYRPPSLESARRLWDIFFVQCGALFYEPEISAHRDQLSPTFLDFLNIAASRPPLSAPRLLEVWAQMDLLRATLLAEMEAFPILLTPVCSMPAFLHGERSWTIDGQTVGYLDAMRFTQWFNLLGAPAAVVPIAASSSGLPIGVQIAGRPFADEAVLTIAGVLDRDFGYRKPPIS